MTAPSRDAQRLAALEHAFTVLRAVRHVPWGGHDASEWWERRCAAIRAVEQVALPPAGESRVEGELTPMSAPGSPSTSGRKAREREQTDQRSSGRHENPPCAQCGGPHPFDTTVPSPTWNRVIRGAGLPDYLCLTCIVKAFVKANEGFTAELWSKDVDGLPLEIRINSAGARTAADLSTENTTLRHTLQEARAAIRKAATFLGDHRAIMRPSGQAILEQWLARPAVQAALDAGQT